MGGDMLWVPRPHGCPCPQCPRASLGARSCLSTPTHSRDRVTRVPTHTDGARTGSHVSPHSPGCLTPPPWFLLLPVPQFPQLSFPVPRTRYPEGHCHCWCPRVLAVPHRPQTTGSTRPPLLGAAMGWVRTCRAQVCPASVSPFPTPFGHPARPAQRLQRLTTKLTRSALPIFDPTRPDPPQPGGSGQRLVAGGG